MANSCLKMAKHSLQLVEFPHIVFHVNYVRESTHANKIHYCSSGMVNLIPSCGPTHGNLHFKRLQNEDKTISANCQQRYLFVYINHLNN